MSFIYARKMSNSILILGDTKITLNESQGRMLWNDDKARDDVEKYGIIKNVIVTDNICICFVCDDNIHEVNQFLYTIAKERLQLEDLINYAFMIHMNCPVPKVDFLVCYTDGNRQAIYQIKDKRCEEVDFAWLGSKEAFDCFQCDYHTQKPKGGPKTGFQDMTIEYRVYGRSDDDDEVEKIFNSFYHAIYNCEDDTVGGFPIQVLYNNNKESFEYCGYARKSSYRQMTKIADMLRNTPQEGDYTVIQYDSRKQVGLFILHANIGLIYGLDRSNNGDLNNTASNMLYIPFSMKILQLDYYIQTEGQGIKAPLWLDCDPYDFDEIYKRLDHYKNYPKIVLKYVNKLIEVNKMFHEHENKMSELLKMKRKIEQELNQTKLTNRIATKI